MAPVLKTGIPERVSGVQIPPSPPVFQSLTSQISLRVRCQPVLTAGFACVAITLQSKIAFVTDLGKLLIFVDGMVVVVGLGLVLAGRAHFPLGRLPEDFVYRGKNTTFYFPLGTSIVISVVLTVLMYVVGKMRK
jgi:hypothetical protein